MNLNKGITRFCQKCIGKLSRHDAEFFFSPGTKKDLSLFWSLGVIKEVDFDHEFDLDMKLVRYLQILMILSSISDDPRDQNLVEKFMEVPFICEEIIKKNLAYKNTNNIESTYSLIKERYPLPIFWELGGLDTEYILSKAPIKDLKELNRILENYSTPIVGMVAVLGSKPRDFNFFQELKTLAGFEISRKPCSKEYKRTVKWLLKLKNENAA